MSYEQWQKMEHAFGRGIAEDDLAGYAVVMRATTSPYWEREIFVGKATEYTFEGLSIDDIVIGVKAIDKDGNVSERPQMIRIEPL